MVSYVFAFPIIGTIRYDTYHRKDAQRSYRVGATDNVGAGDEKKKEAQFGTNSFKSRKNDSYIRAYLRYSL